MDVLGCKTHIEDGILKVIIGALVVIKAEKIVANLYKRLGDTLQGANTSVPLVNEDKGMMMMWHHILGHVSKHGLQVLT